MTETDIRPVALVTGCQRGIGRAIAVALADAGFDIAANDREPSELLSETLRLVEARGAHAAAFAADIADLAAHEGLLERASAHFGRLDCLVNNAGVSVLARGDLLAVSPESWDRCLAVNTRGPFFLRSISSCALLSRCAVDDSCTQMLRRRWLSGKVFRTSRSITKSFDVPSTSRSSLKLK